MKNKAILIIDEMPTDCLECRCSDGPHGFLKMCKITGMDADDEDIDAERRPTWCPLKPLPSREDIHEEIYQAYGLGKEERYERMRDAVDKVLDEILGEEE